MKLWCSPVLHPSLVHQPERLVQVVVVQDLSHEQLVIVSENYLYRRVTPATGAGWWGGGWGCAGRGARCRSGRSPSSWLKSVKKKVTEQRSLTKSCHHHDQSTSNFGQPGLRWSDMSSAVSFMPVKYLVVMIALVVVEMSRKIILMLSWDVNVDGIVGATFGGGYLIPRSVTGAGPRSRSSFNLYNIIIAILIIVNIIIVIVTGAIICCLYRG